MPFTPALLRFATAACLALAAATEHADYPDRPVRLLVPFSAGGATDVTARFVATELGKELGQSVVVENRPGAGGAIAAQAVASARPDGYALLFGTTGTLAINPSLYSSLSYDPQKSFAPIATVASSANVLVVRPDLPARNVGELVALAKAQPGKLQYGSSGNGSSSHLSGVQLGALAGLDLQHIPYKGSSDALNDFLAGRIDFMIDTLPTYVDLARAGKVRALAVTGQRPSPLYPGVPVMADSLPGYEVSIWYALLAPAGTPADVVGRVADALQRIVSRPDTRARLQQIGSEPFFKGPADFAAFIRSEGAHWAELVKQSGAHIN